MHWFDGLIVVGAERRRRTILSRCGGRLAAARRPPHRLNALSRIVSFDDVPVARRRMMRGQPDQGFERNVFDCAGAGRVFGVRIGLPDWNNVLAMPGHRVCTAVAMQPPAGPPQVESDLAPKPTTEGRLGGNTARDTSGSNPSLSNQKVPANCIGFPASRNVRQCKALARQRLVCGGHFSGFAAPCPRMRPRVSVCDTVNRKPLLETPASLKAIQVANALDCRDGSGNVVDPVTPSSMTSGAEPLRNAMTGVPQAIASIMTIPNGSG